MKRIRCLYFLLLWFALGSSAPTYGAGTVTRQAALPTFDAHLHYNWEPVPHLPLARVLALFRENEVTGILATSRPNDGTRALYEAQPKDLWVVPFIRP